jgi:hypothetical protein
MSRQKGISLLHPSLGILLAACKKISATALHSLMSYSAVGHFAMLHIACSTSGSLVLRIHRIVVSMGGIVSKCVGT